MSTTAPASPPLSIDVTDTAPVPFGRLVGVELRKMGDTRSGRWLLISIAAFVAIVLAIQMAVVLTQDLEIDFEDLLLAVNVPMGVLLPVLGIMSITSEWSQRTAMTTFVLEPSRARLVVAKFAAATIIAVIAVLVGLTLSILDNLLYGALSGNELVWDLDAMRVLGLFLLHFFGMATGFAFGMLFLSTPVGIVVFFVYSFVLPSILSIGAALLGWFEDLQPWIDFNFSQTPLLDAGDMEGEEWAQLFTSGLIWLVLPFVAGTWRVLRSEVK